MIKPYKRKTTAKEDSPTRWSSYLGEWPTHRMGFFEIACYTNYNSTIASILDSLYHDTQLVTFDLGGMKWPEDIENIADDYIA